MTRTSNERRVEVHNPSGLPTADFYEFKPLQGDLKTLSDENKAKLKASILKYGFRFPFFVWLSSEEEKWINDGHQREKALAELEAEGYMIPPLPYVKIEAKDRREAAELLLQANSRYGEYNSETTFFADFDIDPSFLGEIAIRELNFLFPIDNPEDHWVGMPEFKQEDLSSYQPIHVHFKSKEDVIGFAELIGQKITEKTRAIWYPEAEKLDLSSELYES